ncbi:hypothetical protein P43SY_004862 [Pythium insidiosum]|uniref:Uncharacterized protein n=1 Tax=Pythium insidiosum TaxID=114742 RepID=A0AAD5LDG9_PYTIN|nr:hypothetical protein P43SY_004862 [Pythium insidiosum]
MEAAATMGARATESVKRRGFQLSSELKEFVSAFAARESSEVAISFEVKLLCALVVLFLFLLFLIAVLWDRYGKEIGELYTPNMTAPLGDGASTDMGNPNDVADEYTVYQKLPTFFYEYVPKKRN